MNSVVPAVCLAVFQFKTTEMEKIFQRVSNVDDPKKAKAVKSV